MKNTWILTNIIDCDKNLYDVIINGDWNFYVDNMFYDGLTQCANGATHKQGHILDLIISE